jgi:hypothetical protein
VYISLGERELAKGIEQRGIALGMEKSKEEIVKKFLMRGDYPPEVISEIADLLVGRMRTPIN